MLIFPWIFQHHRLPSKVRNWIDGAGIALDVALCAGTSQNATGEETGDDSITIAACKPFGDRDTTKHYFHAIDMLDENALKELLHTRQKSHGKPKAVTPLKKLAPGAIGARGGAPGAPPSAHVKIRAKTRRTPLGAPQTPISAHPSVGAPLTEHSRRTPSAHPPQGSAHPSAHPL